MIRRWVVAMSQHHEKYMQMALQLAERGRYSVSPNPLVGCVLVNDDHVVGSGWHEKAGGPHAECFALEQAGSRAHGATAYLTLEPCSHVGRTPPCAPQLVAAGIKTAYIATLDPNPLVNGQGVAHLQAAGITVHVGLCAEAARQQNRIFFHFIQQKKPFVIAKWAMSLDGKTSVQKGDDRQLSSEESQHKTHELRHGVDAIVVGSHTAIQDDPLLTVRYLDTILKHPIRLILCGQTLLPFNLRVLDQTLPGATWLIVPENIDAAWYQAAQKQNVTVIPCMTDEKGQIHLPTLMDYLATKGITSILVEGGMSLLQSFFTAGLVNESHVFLTPTIIGSLAKKMKMTVNSMQAVGVDYHLTATHEVKHV